MGQSLVKNYIHIVFSTKKRETLIRPPYEQELHAYLGGTCNALDCPVLIVGGYTDHVHILCMLSKKIALMTLVQKIKENSSKWIKKKDKSLENFFWQDGYGAFSVNPSQVDVVVNYIKNQQAHHTKKSFQEEYISFLKEYNVDYNRIMFGNSYAALSGLFCRDFIGFSLGLHPTFINSIPSGFIHKIAEKILK